MFNRITDEVQDDWGRSCFLFIVWSARCLACRVMSPDQTAKYPVWSFSARQNLKQN